MFDKPPIATITYEDAAICKANWPDIFIESALVLYVAC